MHRPVTRRYHQVCLGLSLATFLYATLMSPDHNPSGTSGSNGSYVCGGVCDCVQRATHDVKLCLWLNAIMILITFTTRYHCNGVLRSHIIIFGVVNVTAECDCELRRGVFTAMSRRLFTMANIVAISNIISLLLLH